MFVIENGKITSEKTLDIGKIRVINLVFKSDLDFADDDKFKLILGDVQSVNFAFVNDGCFRFSYVNVAEIIKKENTDLTVKVTCNDEQILSDSITITAYVQGGGSGEEIQGIIYNALPIENSTQIKVVPSDFTKDFTDFSSMFNGCSKLSSIPQLNTSNGTNFSYMFYNCSSLKTIPQLNTSNGTDLRYIFYGCSALTAIPKIDTSNNTKFIDMFNGCKALTIIPPLDTAKGNEFTNMFKGCSKLSTIPQIDVSNSAYFANMFSGCSALTSIPRLNTAKGQNCYQLFYNCSALTAIPQLVATYFNETYNMFKNCSALTDFGGLLNMKKSYSLSDCTKLTHESLLNVLNGLFDLTGSTSKTLTLGSTNLAKLTDQEKAIATNKNWVLA